MWTSQVQNPSNVPFKSTFTSVEPLLMDVNQPPTRGRYNLWIQPPIIGGQIYNVTPLVAIPNVNMGQPIWKPLWEF